MKNHLLLSLKKSAILLLMFYAAAVLSQVQLDENSTLIENIPYKNIDTGDKNRVVLDIYKPKTSDKKIPVLVHIHGGAWVEGNKNFTGHAFSEMAIEKLLKLGYAVVSINYRLVNHEIHFPVPVQDCKDAVKWIRKNADAYNFDTENIGVWGGSAGGHLALLTAYTDDSKFMGDPGLTAYSAKVNYVLDDFGPVDMNDILQTKASRFKLFLGKIFKKKIISIRAQIIGAVTGMDITKQREKIIKFCDEISPIKYTKNAVPTMIWHGNKDNVVPLSQSEELLQALKTENILSGLYIIENGDHGFSKNSGQEHMQIADQMVEFVLKNSK